MEKITILIISFIFLGCASAPHQITHYKKSPAYDLMDEAWDALERWNFPLAHKHADECISLYSSQAKKINDACADVESADYGKCSILSDVAQCVYIKAYAYSKTKDYGSMRDACLEVETFYTNAFVFSDSGWPWKPVNACKDLRENI